MAVRDGSGNMNSTLSYMHIVELELEERETERVSSSALVNKPPLLSPVSFLFT